MAQEEAMEAIEKLLRTEKDEKGNLDDRDRVYDQAQGVYDELNKSNAYSKFVRTLGEIQPTYQHVTETHQTQVSQTSAKVTQHDLMSNKSETLSGYRPVHQSEQFQENNVTIVNQPVMNRVWTIKPLPTDNVDRLQNVIGSALIARDMWK